MPLRLRQLSRFQHSVPSSAASSAHLGTCPGDTRSLHFCDITGMNDDPQILLEATLEQISDDYGHAHALNLFALSSREAAGDSNTKNASLPSSVFKHFRFCPSFAVRAVPSPPCSSSESPRHPELPPAPRNCFAKCKMWSFLTR